ncbi:HAD family phosphatase [Maribrevibacterium harenarium]|uniref:HAD family phosphatase n=1 Tax=Maribrevibacterium harenarium TaxID=2589817 RepID=A0A501WF14_9GAMM|nr:HAD family phosphatase [Maribrevibacterium harenarium]TPE48443.1 HAD family phosphatase [Maribrevibacterium harenarium]
MSFFHYEAILFDCDGVIVDTETISSQILTEMLAKCGLHLDAKTLHDQFAGYTTEQNLKTASQMLGKPLPDTFLEDYKAAFKQTISQSLQPIPGITAILDKLTCPIAMATNAIRSETEYKLQLIGLTEHFKTRFCVDDVAHGKPAPDLYLAAAAALGKHPSQCLVIEDSLAGIQAGKAAGATVLGFSANMDADAQINAGASTTFASMTELAQLLGLVD